MAGSYYEVEVRPNADGWSAKLEAQIGATMKAIAAQIRQQLGDAAKGAFDDIGTRLRASLDPAARSAADNLRDQLQRGVRDGLNGTPGNSRRQGDQQGRQFADAFSREVKAKLTAAFRSLPDAPLNLTSSAADVKIAEIRAKLEAAVKDLEIGVDTDVVEARVETLQAELKALAANATDVRVRVNTGAALAEIVAFRAALKGEGSKAADNFEDAFTRTLRSKLTAAFESLPRVEITASSSDVDKEIAKIRRQLEAADRAVKIGVDTKLVDARVDELRLKLERLARTSPDIKVRLNAGTALAELEALKRATNGLSRGTIGNALGIARLKAKEFSASLREANPLIDTIAGKLGVVGSAVGGVSNNLYVALGVGAAIVALISTLGPLIAGAAGGLIGFVGVAGVAVLAVKGLMDSASSGIGKYISDQLNSIQDQFRSLSAIAGEAIAPAVRDVLSTAQRVFATLGPVVEIISGRLGGAVRELGTALLDGIQKAAPLFVEVAGYIEDGAAALRRWVAGPSFQKFIDYAREQLPVVIDFAKDFGKAIIDTLVSLAPIGEVVIKILDKVFEGISKLANSGTLLAVLGALTGPIGAVVGAAGSLFSVLSGGDDDVKSTSNATDDLLASVSGLGDALPVSTDLLNQYGDALGPGLAAALATASAGTGLFELNVQKTAARLRDASSANQAWLDAVKSFDPATANAADKASLLGAALTASRGDLLDFTTAMLSADTATQATAKAIGENLSSIAADGTLLGQSYVDASGKFVAANTAYTAGSSAIASALQTQVKAATDAATATYQHGVALGDSKKAAEDALTQYKGLRQSFIDQAIAAGGTKEEVQGLADKYFAVPGDVETFVKLLGEGDVNTAILGLTEALNRLSDFIGAPKVGLNKTDFDTNNRLVNGDLDYFGNRKVSATADAITGPFNTKMGQANNSLDQFDGRYVGATVDINDFASYKLRGIAGLLLSLPNSKTIYVNTVTGGQAVEYGGVFTGGIKQYAYGGFNAGLAAKMQAAVPSFAAGGIARTPMIAAGSNIARFAELSTQGEAFIPFAKDRRQRAEVIAGLAAKRLGGAYTPQKTVAAARAAAAALPAGGGGGSLLPPTITLVDTDGSIMAKVAVIADQSYAANTAERQFRSGGSSARTYG